MVDDDYTPKYAELKLMSHVGQKGFQAGSLLGLVGAVPVMAFRAKGLSVDLVTKGAGYGALGGLGLSLLLGFGRRMTIDKEGVEDRAYRLHYNEGQNRVDVFCAVGSTLGLAVAWQLLRQAAASQPPTAINYVGGAAVGCVAGLLAHAATWEGKK